ncbi:type IV secretion system protein [Burkholderia sp. AW33-5]
MSDAAFTPSAFIASFEMIPESFLQDTYPAVANALSMPVYFLAVIYLALYGYAVYDGRTAFSGKDCLARLLTVTLVLGTLSWGGFAGQLYHMAIELMNGIGGTIISGKPVSSTLDGVMLQCGKIVNAMLNAGLSNIGIVLLGILVYGVTEVFLILASVYIVISKIMLAVVFVLLPLVVAGVFWSATRQWFMNWASMVLNAVFIYILTFAVLKFGFQFADTYFQKAQGLTGLDAASLTFSQIAFIIPTFGVLFLFLLQVKSWAAALSGGAVVQSLSLINRLRGR